MKRTIINIDKEKCDGCGICVKACHEGAIGMVNGKAELLRDDYCDGLGDCLPACPQNAISFVEREAAAYDEEAVKKHMAIKKQEFKPCQAFNVPTSFNRPNNYINKERNTDSGDKSSLLSNWPIQIKLAPVNAPYFNNAKLLIAASCSAFSHGDFHNKFVKDHLVLIGCPKLDEVDYSEKLTEILKHNNIKSVKLVRMEVPCCGGLETAVKKAIQNSGKTLPWSVSILSRDGNIVDEY